MNLVDRIRRHFPPKSHVAPGDLCWLRLELGDAHRFPLLNNRECIVLSERAREPQIDCDWSGRKAVLRRE